MSAFGTKRTSEMRTRMSAFGGKADMDQHRHPRSFPGFRSPLLLHFVEPEKRALLLERITAKLDLDGPIFTDSDVDRAIASAMVGLIHEPAA